MAGAYSVDLRERVLTAVEAGEAAPAVAQRFAVGRSTVRDWVRAWRQDGRRGPGKMGGHLKPKVSGNAEMALPGQPLAAHGPDHGLACDLVACEGAHASERAAIAPSLDSAQPGELWIAGRHVCTAAVLAGLEGAGAAFVVREHGRHPRLAGQGNWHGCGRTSTGQAREQAIRIADQPGAAASWRRIELALDQPTEDGDATIRLWSNLPTEAGAGRTAEPYRTRWRIEGMFGRLERVLNSEVASLGHPRAALLRFAASVLAYNALALLARCVEQANQPPAHEPPLQVSTFHLAQQAKGTYEGPLTAGPPKAWPSRHEVDPAYLAERLLALARDINPRTVATSKRSPKPKAAKGCVDGKTARAHVATARVLAQAKTIP